MKTEEKILTKALAMFNEQGIEYVGMRELAGLLNMRVSNITYYFPTKDDLVNRLSVELNQLNSKVVLEDSEISMFSFLTMLQSVFHNHVKYRCLLLSFVHLMDQNKIMAMRYKQTERDRNATLKSNMQMLIENGYIKLKKQKDLEVLVSTLALIIRFWISEAQISYRHLPTNEQISHYLKIIIKLISPYATKKAKMEMKLFKSGLQVI